MAILLLLWFQLSAALLCYVVANDKDHPAVNWFLVGLFFGPIALIAVAGMGDRDLRRQIRLMVDKQGVDSSPKRISY